MKTLLFSGLFLLVLAVSPLMAEVTGKTFVNGYGANFQPFAFTEKGQATGFDIEAINWIANKLGFTVQHLALEWDNVIQRLIDKKVDLVASGLSITPERAGQIAFTKPYWNVKQHVLASKDATFTAQEALTSGYKIGVLKGTSEAKAMETSNGVDGRRYELESYVSNELAANDLINGRIKALIFNDPSTNDILKNPAIKVIGDAGFPPEQFSYGVHKDNKELLEALNQGLELLKADPYWQILIDKYKPGGTK
ncbi:MAG: ABC transporter substrate-binding protein [Deltaproteobacteria bacterium]|jgi:polar amino acid transport system substrate-binding protein|nr:ABC transporter substrate-binding protein [Deltaproteobacteria bacterium]